MTDTRDDIREAAEGIMEQLCLIIGAAGDSWRDAPLGDGEKMRDAIEAALRAERARGLEDAAPTHRHVKRGTEYVLIGVGKMQSDNWHTTTLEEYQLCGDVRVEREVGAPVDMREVAIYRSTTDGSLWARPREEFEDGRFEAIRAKQKETEG